jgi:hypothetical protein
MAFIANLFNVMFWFTYQAWNYKGPRMTSMEVVEDKRYKKLSISLPVVVLEETDKVRGDVARSVYIRRALEQYNCNNKRI